MFKVLECVAVQHDHGVVALAAVICVVGMLAFFLIHNRAVECTERRRRIWLAVASATGGLAVWATHFVAMLAYRGTVAIEFDAPLTVISALVVIAGFWASLRIGEEGNLRSAIAAGFVAALTIAVMHLIGTEAIRAAAQIRYDVLPIIVGAIVSFMLLSVAIRVSTVRRNVSGLVAALTASVLAICVLHFTGMSATELVPDPSLPAASMDGSGRVWLMGAVSIVVSVIILTAVIASFVDRYLTDLHGFANATLEGLAIVRDGVVIETNTRFTDMLGRSDAETLGVSIDDLLVTSDGHPLSTDRCGAFEAVPADGGRVLILEVAVHTIEYRGRSCQVLAVRDLTEKRVAERQIEHMARHDALTDLPNRVLFKDRLEAAMHSAALSNENLAVLALDLDRFKAVNDVFGHAAGDQVLVRVADIIRRSVGPADTPARIGGDEFVILQVGVDQPVGAHMLADKILETFRAEMNVSIDPMAVGVSIGAAVYPNDGETPDDLRNAADMALYDAKASGRGAAAFYSADMDAEARERREIENELRHAVLRNQLSLVFQPLFEASHGACTGYEALMRWNHPEWGYISPSVFIPIAEETGIIVTLGEWALREACRTASQWDHDLAVAVNVSAVQFRFPNLVDIVSSALEESGLQPFRLELEITETSLLKDRESTLATLLRLKALGVHVVMDDFGTGYSSLSNLHSFPFDKIKIDRSFISSMEVSESARAIVKAIVGLGKSLELPVVAEGIETFGQHRMVVEDGCEQLQGFLLGKPKSAGEVEEVSGYRPSVGVRLRG